MDMEGRDLTYLLGELNGKMDRVICELQKINGRLNKHEERLEEHDRVLQQHKSYFKIIGGVITAIIAFITAMLSKL